jgi:hypothetical protein
MKDKLIGSVYVKILQDENGEIKFSYGYEIDDKEIRLNDLSMLNSFLDKLKQQAQEDFNNRLEVSDKEFSIESEKEGQECVQ